MPPEPDEFDALIDQAKKKVAEGQQAAGDEFDGLIAKSRAMSEKAVGSNDSPHVERPWYDFWSQYTNPTSLERSDFDNQNRQEQEQAAKQITNTFEHPASIVTRELGPGVGMLMGGPEVGELWMGPWATRAARAGVGGLAGGVTGGVDALARGESLGDAAATAGNDALMGAGVTAGLDVAGTGISALGRKTSGAANRKLAERSLSSAELNDLRAEGGGAAVRQTGQELRDLGITKPRGLGDWWGGNTPERMSENSVGILNNAREELDRSTQALTSAPARDVSQITSGYDPKPVTVGQAPVDVSPINKKLHGQADALDYAKNPDKARVYRDLASELTTPARPREPAPITSEQPVVEPAPATPDAPVSQLPFESRIPEQPADPAALSSEPTGPIEPNAPPMSSQPLDDGNLLDLPPPTGPGEIDTTSHLARPYETSQTPVSSEPLLDLEPPPSRMMKPGAIDANMSEQPVDTYQGVATKPLGRPLDLPADDGANLLLTPPDHAISSPYNADASPVDQSYWPAPYEMSRNEPPMPAQEPGLAPAKQTVLEPTPRFKGDSPAPGLELDQPRGDFQPDNLLAPTALYPDNPPLPQGELAPPGMSRRSPIVGPIQRSELSKLTGARPTSSNLGVGEAGPLDVSGISPTSAPIDVGRAPQTPRPEPLPDPSTGFTMDQLMAMRRELGNQTRNFSGRPLNKVEGDMGAATRDAWKGAGDAITGALDQHVEAGNLTPDIVNSYRDANKTFSTIADVNKNLATRTNADFKTPSSIGNETVLGGGYKAVERAKDRMLGLNAQYGIGEGIEGVGNAAQAGSDLARMSAGLGWTQNRDEHPEIEQARAENPQAPKALVEQKANDSMKERLQKAWYNVLGAFQQ